MSRANEIIKKLHDKLYVEEEPSDDTRRDWRGTPLLIEATRYLKETEGANERLNKRINEGISILKGLIERNKEDGLGSDLKEVMDVLNDAKAG